MLISVRTLEEADIEAVAALFTECFAESVRHHCNGRLPKAAAMQDVFALVRRAEPGAAFGAFKQSGELLAYCFAPTDLKMMWWEALKPSGLPYWFRRWLQGDYGIGLWPLKMIVMNKLSFVGSALQPGYGAKARILSIAVDECARGCGCGRLLLRAGLDYQREQGAKKVRLEVRPENKSALHLYESEGFKVCGRTSDSQGEWVIMLKEMG